MFPARRSIIGSASPSRTHFLRRHIFPRRFTDARRIEGIYSLEVSIVTWKSQSQRGMFTDLDEIFREKHRARQLREAKGQGSRGTTRVIIPNLYRNMLVNLGAICGRVRARPPT